METHLPISCDVVNTEPIWQPFMPVASLMFLHKLKLADSNNKKISLPLTLISTCQVLHFQWNYLFCFLFLTVYFFCILLQLILLCVAYTAISHQNWHNLSSPANLTETHFICISFFLSFQEIHLNWGWKPGCCLQRLHKQRANSWPPLRGSDSWNLCTLES